MSAMPARPKSSGFVHWRINIMGERIPFVPCVDGNYHRYLTADHIDLEASPPRCPQTDTTPDLRPACCSCCGYASSELKGTKATLCSECLWDQIAERILALESEGISLMSHTPDHQSLRMRCPNLKSLNAKGRRGNLKLW